MVKGKIGLKYFILSNISQNVNFIEKKELKLPLLKPKDQTFFR